MDDVMLGFTVGVVLGYLMALAGILPNLKLGKKD